MSTGRRLSILAEEDDDPMLSAVNLVDVFLVLVVALLTAVALQQQSHANETVIRNPGQPGMEIVVRKDGQEIKYRGNGGSAEGQGERAGVAYVPYGRRNGLFEGHWAAYRPLIDGPWDAYLSGQGTMDEAVHAMVTGLPPVR